MHAAEVQIELGGAAAAIGGIYVRTFVGFCSRDLAIQSHALACSYFALYVETDYL